MAQGTTATGDMEQVYSEQEREYVPPAPGEPVAAPRSCRGAAKTTSRMRPRPSGGLRRLTSRLTKSSGLPYIRKKADRERAFRSASMASRSPI